MKLFVLYFLLSSYCLQAQKDSMVLKPATKVKLTVKQQQWLNANYKKIAVLKKDSAAKIVRSSFATIPEASLEYLISRSAELQQADAQKELALLRQMLTQLQQQKQALLRKIREKEEQLARETDPAKRTSINNSILELKRQLRQVEESISNKEKEISERE